MPVDERLLFYILVPVYKVEKYIKDCIESVINQSYQNFELILVDDGSPDLSGQICDDYARDDSRIHVIHQKNMGLIAARRTAINYLQEFCDLKNAYVMFLDSDDSIKQGALDRLAEVISYESYDMVIYGLDRVSNGRVIKAFNDQNKPSFIEVDKRRLYKRVFSNASYNPLWRKAIKAELIPDKNYEKYYKYSMTEDLLQSIDFYKVASKVYFLQESLYNYSINPKSITNSVNYHNYKVDYAIREKVEDFLQDENVFTERDWEEYHGYCASLVINSVATISEFDIPYAKKKQLYQKIKDSKFYKQSLQSGKYKCSLKVKILTCTFKMSAYRIFDIYGCLKRLYGKIKK